MARASSTSVGIYQHLRSDLAENGTDNFFLWTILDIKANLEAYHRDRQPKTYKSKTFYVNPFGYRLVCVATLTDNLNIYFAVVKGEYDALLKWPFSKKISVSILSQVSSGSNLKPQKAKSTSGDHIRILQADPVKHTKNWKRPVDDTLTNLVGIQPFKSIEEIIGNKPDYISEHFRNDQIHLKISILDEGITTQEDSVCQFATMGGGSVQVVNQQYQQRLAGRGYYHLL